MRKFLKQRGFYIDLFALVVCVSCAPKQGDASQIDDEPKEMVNSIVMAMACMHKNWGFQT